MTTFSRLCTVAFLLLPALSFAEIQIKPNSFCNNNDPEKAKYMQARYVAEKAGYVDLQVFYQLPPKATARNTQLEYKLFIDGQEVEPWLHLVRHQISHEGAYNHGLYFQHLEQGAKIRLMIGYDGAYCAGHTGAAIAQNEEGREQAIAFFAYSDAPFLEEIGLRIFDD